jgi:hypothetical protein
MKRIAVTVFLSIGLLASCSDGDSSDREPAREGAAGLGDRMTTVDQVSSWIRDKAGDCAELTEQDPSDLRGFVGTDIVGLYEPYVAEWATCSVSPDVPKVAILLFTEDGQREFQESWREAMTAGTVADGPSFAFGNGFAVSAGALGVTKLDLYYLRCDYDDPKVRQLPADVPGCVFADPEHGHH